MPASPQDINAHRVSAQTQKLDLADSVGFLEDEGGRLDAAQVAALARRGAIPRVAFPKTPMLRSVSTYTFWLVIDVAADASVPPDWMFVLGSPVFDVVQVFTQSPGGNWSGSAVNTSELPFSARPIPNRNLVFPVRLSPGGTTTFLVRVQDHGSRPVRVALWQPEALHASDLTHVGAYAAYFGLLAGMILYNLLLFVVVRDRGFLLYVGSFAFLGIGTAGNTGLGAQFVWGEWPWLQTVSTNFGYAVATAFSAMLTARFLSTSERLPAADAMLKAIALTSAFVALVSLGVPKYMAGIAVVCVSTVSSVASLGLSILAAVRGWPGARYFLAACASIHLFILVALASFLKIIPWKLTAPEVTVFGSALQLVFLSLALADRINEERRQKERAQANTLAILEASHALGSETRLDRLHARLYEILARLTGATRVHFILRDADSPGQAGALPLSALREIERDPRPLLVDDVRGDARFAGDPAFADAANCSLLVLPVLHQGIPRAVLMLENRERTAAFSNVEVETVAAIAGPLAVSLENVLLYENLEQRVATQTRELRETQERLVATARRAGMAEIATNVLHNVGNVLNSVNVSANLMRKQLEASRMSGLSRVVDLLDSAGGDPGTFIRDDPRGRMVPRYLGELSAALEDERRELLEHLARLASSVDHIKNVVTVQQSYAGRSIMVERVQPSDLMEDALRMANATQRARDVEVQREFAPVPHVLLDKSRTMQILVNLVNNAHEAMEDTEERGRTLTLRISAEDDRLNFVVMDRGRGIRPEDLSRIFAHGFSTRAGGHGFGLHSCAIAAGEMGGTLEAHSDGPGRGAKFMLTIPIAPA